MVDSADRHDVRAVLTGLSRGGKVTRGALIVTAVLVAALMGLSVLVYVGYDIGVAPLLIGIVTAALPLPVYLAFALWLDRYEKEPVWMLAGAFFWGATVAVFLSFVLNTIGGPVLADMIGEMFSGAVSAPVVEESTKGLALFILYWWKKDEFNGILDGILYATMVGLGFTLVEDALYYGRAVVEAGAIGLVGSFVIRGLLSTFMHPLFTSMTGIGLGLASRSDNRGIKLLAPAAGLLMAMDLHFLWDFAAAQASEDGGVVEVIMYLAVIMPALLGVLALAGFSLGQERAILRRNLTPELQNGLLSQEEYDSLSTARGRLGSSLHALEKGGIEGWRVHSRFRRTATRLAFHRQRVSESGTASEEDTSREAAYVESLRDLKNAQFA